MNTQTLGAARRPSLVLVFLAVVAVSAAIGVGTRPALAAGTAGSGTYTVPTSYSVVPGGTVGIQVSYSAVTNGTTDGVTARPPDVCYSAAGNPADVSLPFFGNLTMSASPRTLNVTALPGATVGNTFTVTFSLPCATSYSVSDGGTINGGASAVVTVTIVSVGSPTVTSVSPASGPMGTSVTVLGTNFTGGSTVAFVGTPTTAATKTFVNSGQLTVTVPGGLTIGNTYDIVVNNGSPSPTSVNDRFVVTNGPTVTSVSPASGPIGQSVTLIGTNFTGTTCPTGVTFGGTPATSCTVWSNTSITAVAPTGAGTVDILVNNGSATSPATLQDKFTYTSAVISVASINPPSGPTTGGTSIQLTGTNLNLVSSVTIDGVSCYSIVATYSYVTCTTGAHPGSGTYAVVVNFAASGVTFTYGTGYTNVTGITPISGSTLGGTPIQLTGTNLGGVTTVTIDGVSCYSVVPTYFYVTCTTGAHPTVGTYTVYVNGLPTGVSFTYGIGVLPAVYSVTPNSGPASGSPLTYVVISGANFTNVQSVTFGGTAAVSYTVQDVNTIQAISPAHSAGTFDVIVTTLAGSSPNTVNDNFTFTGTGVPTVSGVSPSSGTAGTSVIITGSGFTGALYVRFGGVAATFTVSSDTQISATVPAGLGTGTVDVIVTNAAGSSTNTTADNFTNTAAATTSYTLYATWTLFVWNGASGTDIGTALSGSSTNTQLNSILSRVTEILWWNASIQAYKAWFPAGASTPGANDFTTFTHGLIYWVAITPGSSLTWTIAATAN